ncbi:MAG: nucleoside hydrolase, partial [Alloscardovia omnicolens]|nr:nucleoside hydrolase [Alloscardovia omnicolens]
MSQKMILDLDTGVDDAMAIAYALASPEVELIGITGTYGNVLMDQGTRNALAITDILGHPEVPVFRGIDHSRSTESFEVLDISAFIHGKNGIGDVDIPDSPRHVEQQDAVEFIIESVHKYGKDLVYVPTGPDTNIAAAIEKDPSIIDEIGNIVIMGGALTVPGNVNAWTEANISQDPEAANILFRSGAPVTMIGLDVTLQTLLRYEDTQKWRDIGTDSGKFYADMVDYYIKA